MRGLDISSSKYLDMTYFIDSLITECDARLVYYDKQLSALGVNPGDEMAPEFSPSDYFNPSSVEYFLDLKAHDLNNAHMLTNLKEYYINLLSISEFTLYNSVDQNTDFSDECSVENNIKRLKITELERSRISSDLHDSSIQILTGLVHRCEFIIKLLDFDLPRSKMELFSVISDLKDAINGLRALIFNMRAPSLSDFSLEESIEDYCNYKNKNRKVSVFVSSSGEEKDFSPIGKSNLYRIFQEAFNNILSHSDGNRADIHIDYGENDVTMTIRDNGKGINDDILSKNTLGKKNFGLLIMKERTEIIGGSFCVSSIKPGGTEVKVCVPRNPEVAV